MKYTHNDGGRSAAGYKGTTGDCVCRAIAIASGRPYQEIYDLLNQAAQAERPRKGLRILTMDGIKTLPGRTRSEARSGVFRKTYEKVIKSLGGTWRPLMQIGTGCKVHLRPDELPKTGRHILSLSKHLTAWVDGELHDIYDCSREGTRCVYGIYTFPG